MDDSAGAESAAASQGAYMVMYRRKNYAKSAHLFRRDGSASDEVVAAIPLQTAATLLIALLNNARLLRLGETVLRVFVLTMC